MKRRKLGFTLVELLVVVGIIAVLASLIFPSLNYARNSAIRTKCSANQGQVMKTILPVMAQDNSFLISGTNSSVENDITITDPLWISYLVRTGRVQDLAAYRCPGLEYATPSNLTGNDNKAASCAEAYGMVTTTSGSRLPWSGTREYKGFDFRGSANLSYGTNKDKVAPNMLALGGCAATVDSNSKQLEARSTLDFSASKGGAVAIHGDVTNLFFLDGHTESVTKEAYDDYYYPTGSAAQKVSSNSWLNPNE